jgi:hypothetical protein
MILERLEHRPIQAGTARYWTDLIVFRIRDTILYGSAWEFGRRSSR